jgi:hypothetical protein
MLCWRVISEALGLPEKCIKLTKCGRASSILPVHYSKEGGGSCDTNNIVITVLIIYTYLPPSFGLPS